jgi:predicted transcriptional regulator
MVNYEAELKSPSALRQFLLLLNIKQFADYNRHRSADVTGLYEEAEKFGLDWRAFDSDLEMLLDKGWIFYEKTSGKTRDVTITQQGVDAADDFRSFMTDPRKRNIAARDAVLQWLYDEHLHGRSSPNIARFTISKYGKFYGDDFTENETAQATRILRERELIRGTAVMGGSVIRPDITALGIQKIEDEDMPPAVAASERSPVIHINNSGSMNLTTGGKNVSQAITLTSNQVDDVRKVATALRDMLPILGIPAERQAEVVEVATELEQETNDPAPAPGRMKSLLSRMMELLALGTAEGAVEALNGLAEKALENL